MRGEGNWGHFGSHLCHIRHPPLLFVHLSHILYVKRILIPTAEVKVKQIWSRFTLLLMSRRFHLFIKQKVQGVVFFLVRSWNSRSFAEPMLYLESKWCVIAGETDLMTTKLKGQINSQDRGKILWLRFNYPGVLLWLIPLSWEIEKGRQKWANVIFNLWDVLY